MKKFLLLTAGVAMAMAANAQVEVGFMDAEALGLADQPTMESNTVLAQTASVTMTFLNGQTVKKQDPFENGFKTLIVNGEQIQLVSGMTASDNGKANLDDGPTAGTIYNFEVKEDGWLIVASKISSNKNFYAFEGKVGEDPAAMAYTLGMDLHSDAYPDMNQIVFSLPAGEYGWLNREAADIDKYTFGGNTIEWPIRIAAGNVEATTGGNGTGVIMFPVAKEGANYMVLATGSKMNTCGYVFVPGVEQPSVSIYRAASDEYSEATIVVSGDPAGISDIAVDNANADTQMYNVFGQKVNASYKGIVIKNGQKFYNR